MPGFELIDENELKNIENIFEESNGVLFAHGFDGLRNGFVPKCTRGIIMVQEKQCSNWQAVARSHLPKASLPSTMDVNSVC